MFTKSIAFGLDHVDPAVDYAMQYSRGQPKDTITRFVRMYVNDLTLDLGPSGRRAIEKLFEMAKDRGVIKNDVAMDVI